MRHIKQQETVVLEIESYTEKTPVSFGIFIAYITDIICQAY